MTVMLTMTQAQADAVRGETVPGHSLEPVKPASETEWVLGLEVLADPNQAAKHDVLASYPTRDVSADEFAPPMLA